jgi:hypothetical protein
MILKRASALYLNLSIPQAMGVLLPSTVAVIASRLGWAEGISMNDSLLT